MNLYDFFSVFESDYVCVSVVISGIKIQFVPVHEPTGWWEVHVAEQRTMIAREDEMTCCLNPSSECPENALLVYH